MKLLKDYLVNRKLEDNEPIYAVSSRAVHAYFPKIALKFADNFKGRNPYSPLVKGCFPHFPKRS